jgi:hypothetical protein
MGIPPAFGDRIREQILESGPDRRPARLYRPASGLGSRSWGGRDGVADRGDFYVDGFCHIVALSNGRARVMRPLDSPTIKAFYWLGAGFVLATLAVFLLKP